VGDPWDSWVNPSSILGGVLAVVVVAFLAAVYLVWDADRLADPAMVDYFRRRAVAAAVVAGVVAFAGLFVLHADAAYLYQGLTSRGLPLVIVSAVCGAGTLVLLVRDNHRGARLAAVAAVASIVVAWGVAQWEYLLPTSLTVFQAAAPNGTLATILGVTAAAVVIIFPAFGLLFVLDQRGLLAGEGAEDVIDLRTETAATPMSTTQGAHP
jgi:cytochrome d ubiquinol oxidase subunit II